MELCRVCRLGVEDLHPLDEEQAHDPDPDPHNSEKTDADPH